MSTIIQQWLINWGLSGDLSLFISRALLIIFLLFLSFLANLIAKKGLIRIISRIVKKTKNTWDDIIIKQGVFNRLSHLAPAIVIYFFAENALPDLPIIITLIQRASLAYMLGISLLVIDSFLNAINHIYGTYKISKRRPIKGYIQVFKIFLYFLGIVLMVTTLLNKSAFGFLSGIGALSAVLLLVFKDSILGLVASIQLTANNMINIGDWIEMPKYGADGDVVDITLQTIKVQNWDKTLTTIPIYSLISDSFKNWRGMSDSGGRRIKRAINIDMNSIEFLSSEAIKKYRNIEYLNGYIKTKESELLHFNKTKKLDNSPLNGRQLTNIGTFRAYIIEYLKAHKDIHNKMTFLVRQLPPGQHGIPLEIYVFSKNQVWADYERIQADIFDHLLAALPEFRLAVYQNPSGLDIRKLGSVIQGNKC